MQNFVKIVLKGFGKMWINKSYQNSKINPNFLKNKHPNPFERILQFSFAYSQLENSRLEDVYWKRLRVSLGYKL